MTAGPSSGLPSRSEPHAGGGDDARVFGGAKAIEVVGLQKAFGSKLVLKGIDVSVSEREVLVLIGPSGSGKSTLLQFVARLLPITAGEVRIGGQGVQDGGAGWRRRREIDRGTRALRGEVGMVFQRFNLFPHHDGARQRRRGGPHPRPRHEARTQAREAGGAAARARAGSPSKPTRIPGPVVRRPAAAGGDRPGAVL